MSINVEVLYQLVTGTLLGAMIGAERSLFKKQVGLRTFALVGLGATLFSVLATHFSPDGASRILSNLVVGVGFLGAGIIFYHDEKVRGATTASAFWVTVALGAAIGQGMYTEAFASTFITIIVLAILPYFEKKINKDAEEGN